MTIREVYPGFWECESTDTKPSGWAVGVALRERDTGKFFHVNSAGDWIEDFAAYGSGAHPDLAAHDTLGLATQTELDANAAAHLGLASILDSVFSTFFPVGCLYHEETGVNPGTTFGRGTWVRVGEGQFLVGQKGGDTDFGTAGTTGGAKTHTHVGHAAHVFTQAVAHVVTQALSHAAHIVTQAIAHSDHTGVITHTHVQRVNSGTTGALSGYTPDTSTSTSVDSGYSVAAPTGAVSALSHTAHSGGAVDPHSPHSGASVDPHTGAGVDPHSAHDSPQHLPPWRVIYVWKRTA